MSGRSELEYVEVISMLFAIQVSRKWGPWLSRDMFRVLSEDQRVMCGATNTRGLGLVIGALQRRNDVGGFSIRRRSQVGSGSAGAWYIVKTAALDTESAEPTGATDKRLAALEAAVARALGSTSAVEHEAALADARVALEGTRKALADVGGWLDIATEALDRLTL